MVGVSPRNTSSAGDEAATVSSFCIGCPLCPYAGPAKTLHKGAACHLHPKGSLGTAFISASGMNSRVCPVVRRGRSAAPLFGWLLFGLLSLQPSLILGLLINLLALRLSLLLL